jgi:hypothetical protein
MYRVLHASIRRGSGIIRVVGEGDECLATTLIVDGAPTKRVCLRSARPIFNEDNTLSSEIILIVEEPEFEIETLVGELLVSP